MKKPYEVKSVQVLAKGEGFLMREFTYAPGEATPWHRHSAMTDETVGLSGRITVEMREPDEAQALSPGERNTLPPGRVHRLVNRGTEDARVLLVQHGGRYDFLTDPAPAPAPRRL